MKIRKKWIFTGMGLVLLAPLVLLALLQTPPGKRLLASELERRLGGPDRLNVRIGTISGWIPAKVRIDRLEIGDAEGVWLHAEDLRCRWKLRALADRRIRLAHLGAGVIELRRFPAGTARPSAPGGEPRVFHMPEVVLERLAIGELRLGEAVAGRPLAYTVHSGGITLQSSGRLTGSLSVDGDAEGRIRLDALVGGEQDSRLRVLAELDRMVNPSFGLDRLSGHAEATLTREGVQGRISVSVRKDDLGGELAADLQYAGQRLQVPQFEMSGYGYSAEGTLQVDFKDETADIRLDAAITDAAAQPYALHTAAALSVGNGRWALRFQPLELTWKEQVSLQLEGEIAPERLALKGTLKEFALSSLPVPALTNFTGGAGGLVELTGSMEKPEIRAELDVVRFSSSEDTLDELPELNFHVSARLADGQLAAASVVTNDVHGQLAADFRMPCDFSLDPLRFRPGYADLRAGLKADVQMGILNRLSIFKDQRMAGQLGIDLVYAQHLSGSIRLEQGTYEHFNWGVVVHDVDLDLSATVDGLLVNSATATDGGAGRLEFTGGVVSNRLDLILALDGAAVVRRDDVEGMLSGRLEISGPLARPDIKGSLTVDRADILIDNIPPALPPQLTNYSALEKAARVEVKKKKSTLPFGLDIHVDLADQIYANASMIDSIWGGTLHVRDVPQGISVRGIIEPRRGYVSFIGKKFRFTEGQIDIDGAVPSMPAMNNLTSEYSRSDFTARLILNGRLDNPDFRMESSPAMPEDEILSHVLFNRDTSSISPYQAFQIASAARQLSGGISGPGFMYQMRQAVGVDTLEWREGAEAGDASSVAAGKYLTPALYIEVNRSLDEKGGTGMMAEFDVTRHISVETSTGPEMRPGIGVNWKNDY
jgi:autotransporter translocation and assembly factor TamB